MQVRGAVNCSGQVSADVTRRRYAGSVAFVVCCCPIINVAGGNAQVLRGPHTAGCIPGNAALPCSALGRVSSSNRGAPAPAQPESTKGLSQG